MRNVLQGICLSLIGLLLLAYLLGDRGVAHVGVHPVYIGEAVLALTFCLFLIQPDLTAIQRSPALWLLIALNLWCFAQTVPYLEEYGVDALQDAALYAYSAFAFIVSAALVNAALMERLCSLYGRVITASVIAMPLLLLISPGEQLRAEELPLIAQKPGDVAVHLAGAAIFRLTGLHMADKPQSGRQKLVSALFWACWAVSALWTSSISRGGLLAIICAIALIMVFGFARRQVIAFIASLAFALAVLGLLGVRVEHERRDISVGQLVENVASIIDGDGDRTGDLQNTTEWRLAWWTEILDYTLFGDYFWTGRGFGINLAQADHFQVDQEGRLRSPHNGHLTFLARAGVPGLLLWLGFLAAFAISLIRKARLARRLGLANWQRLYLWMLGYWVAALVNATFDVYLEGPQGGIWFWSIVGGGVGAALHVQAPARRLTPP